MMWKPCLMLTLALVIGISGEALAQYSRTPAGENIDVRIMSRTPDSLKGKAVVGSNGDLLGIFDGVVMAGPGTFGVVTLSTPPNATRRVVVRLTEFKIDRQDRVTTSKSAADLAGSEEYSGHIGYQEITGSNLTIGDGLSSYD